MNRREMISRAGLLATTLSLRPEKLDWLNQSATNPLANWRGFNLLDFFNPNPAMSKTSPEDYFKWIADWGFTFIRLPMAYPAYLDYDWKKPIQKDQVYLIDPKKTEKIIQLVDKANKQGLHVSLNLHRAPGFCINAGFEEPYNLWKDQEAMEAFLFHWDYWAKTFRSKSTAEISFDLLNEPCLREDMNDQFSARTAVPKELYRDLIVKGLNTIKKQHKDHLVVADGNNIGSEVIDNILDLPVSQSCRGYAPGFVSHYKAPWVFKDTSNLGEVTWPRIDHGQLQDKNWLRKEFEPWIALKNKGIGVHCGECGAWRETPHSVALAWMNDMFSILHENQIGFALWEFVGDFGILNSNRKDVDYVDWYGHKLDQKMLKMLQQFT